jgi:hypothetical protein
MTDMHKLRRNTFIIGGAVQALFFLYAILFKQQFVLDTIFCLVAIGLFYLIEQKYPLNPVVIVLGFVPFYFHSLGVLFGFFSLMFFGIGYDKWTHFINSMIATIVIFYILVAHSKERILKHIVLAFLVMLGINLIHEVNEFAGTRYLHIYSESLFSQGDALPPSTSDLQVYDSWWDEIFDIFGGLLAALILAIIRGLEKHHGRDYMKNY